MAEVFLVVVLVVFVVLTVGFVVLAIGGSLGGILQDAKKDIGESRGCFRRFFRFLGWAILIIAAIALGVLILVGTFKGW